MRNVFKNIELNVEGENHSFRISKWDVMSSICLFRAVRQVAPADESIPLTKLYEVAFEEMPEYQLKPLLVKALNHVEMLLPAGYQPVMTGEDFGIEALEYDAKTCLKLAIQSWVWTLQDFFIDGESTSPKKTQDSSQ